MEIYRDELLTDYVGHPVSFCQQNISKSKLGVLRGLHFQTPPFAQSKLIRVLNGLILDVAVDIRQESENFGKYISVELRMKLAVIKNINHEGNSKFNI